jgi:hypothetical protein
MKKTLAALLAKHNVSEIVETLAEICLEKGSIHSPVMDPGRRAMWKCNAIELSMTSGSLYNPRSTD